MQIEELYSTLPLVLMLNNTITLFAVQPMLNVRGLYLLGWTSMHDSCTPEGLRSLDAL